MSKLLEITYKLEDIDDVAQTMLRHITSKTLLFYGDMGTGKTTFIKALLSAIGCNEEVSSPTFSIVNEYMVKDESIYHFDLYRIKDEEDALNFGFEDYFYNSDWIFIEWPENAESLLPKESNKIEISYNTEDSRTIKLSKKR
ncbi:MAG: tRNA (adenosine(37)-N6)-threonylcarbamoyltransferase complex ATPase subunit type 1 TsaE [Psychroserpens sp.]|uniref:tRNA (adenosine(37)-N6)-threonylcarbamoyltransferase complex ATPase subunit type 1 TsaE n=1 Tax=Psychroserpens sp. TaxID=2020870 RepID=UPI003C74F13F